MLPIALLLTTLAHAQDDEKPPPWRVGVEGGYQLMLGSNGDAFAPGPTVRATVDTSDAYLYVAQVSYGFSRHELVNSERLYFEGAQIPEAEGHADLHWLVAGAKVRPMATEGIRIFRTFDPFVSGAAGLVGTVGTMDIPERELQGTMFRVHLEVEIAAGVDIRPARHVVLGVVGRVADLPALRSGREGNVRMENLLLVHPAIHLTYEP